MSQRKRLSASQNKAPSRSQAAVESDDEDDVTFTQLTSTQVQRARESFTPVQIDRKVAEVVQFVLIKDQRKVPIRRADIAKHVIKEYKAMYQDIMKRVCRTFEQVFGLKLVEIDSKSHVYILTNKLESLPEEPVSMVPTSPKYGLLFTILSVIFMKGGVVKEALVWNFMKKLRVDPGERHDLFGDVKKLVTDEFVRQKYLEIARIPHTDPVEFEFRWGVRAEKEVSKKKLLEIVGELFDQDPHSWTQQYREAAAAEASQR
ncbi:necdin-like 2 [Clupea harengus]|uniref:Necdin-like 2 n=1 Tax=Clupea harengus TaxID=7950 RepID=A0A6P8FGN5_CLUHA|nr:necdin-like 2 [Clupea harengus]XP_031422760.1 necdin-like 2 [Clupea harengus]XP_031422761.1 necdin-like 2 [Clupea harengus]